MIHEFVAFKVDTKEIQNEYFERRIHKRYKDTKQYFFFENKYTYKREKNYR